jgi:hypothetical protein
VLLLFAESTTPIRPQPGKMGLAPLEGTEREVRAAHRRRQEIGTKSEHRVGVRPGTDRAVQNLIAIASPSMTPMRSAT